MCRWNYPQCHQTHSNWGTGHKQASLRALLRLRVKYSSAFWLSHTIIPALFLPTYKPIFWMSNISSAIYLTIMKSDLVESGFWFGGLMVFLELFPVLHPNLYTTAPTTHLKNPHIHCLGPFCWGAVSQWLQFFMLFVHQIKTETIHEECELMGTEVNCWKKWVMPTPALPLELLPQGCWCSLRHHLWPLSGESQTSWIHSLCLIHLLEKSSYSWTFP